MKNTFGNSLSITLFGESHGEMIGAVLDGLAPGIKVDLDFISHQLDLRRPWSSISTKRQEPDNFKIVSGLFQGRTTGTPLTILIPNEDTKSKDYEKNKTLARPGHSDYTAQLKYNGFQDYRGGGHFSGRITAPLVAAGAILICALKDKGINIGTHIKKCAGVSDASFNEYDKDIQELSNKQFAVLDDAKGLLMIEKIKEASSNKDSVGGILETVVTGLPGGVGEPWFDSLESVLSHILFSVPGIKGVEFGDGFKIADLKGSEANDEMYIDGGKVYTKTNVSGGINGGISNGMPIIFSCAVRPTATIFKEQQTVDFAKMENKTITAEGRHDPAIIHRARVVVDSVTAIALSDMLTLKFGTDYLGDIK